MSTEVDLRDPTVIDKALLAMIAKQGSPAEGHIYLLEEHGIEIGPSTLSSWKTRDHPERYRQLESQYGAAIEAEIVLAARNNAKRAAEIEAVLLERVEAITDPKDLPAALRAVADVKAKAINEVLALTGRPTDGKQQSNDMASLLKTLVDRKVFTIPDARDEPAVEVEAEVVEA
jgi:hypothetical protein